MLDVATWFLVMARGASDVGGIDHRCTAISEESASGAEWFQCGHPRGRAVTGTQAWVELDVVSIGETSRVGGA